MLLSLEERTASEDPHQVFLAVKRNKLCHPKEEGKSLAGAGLILPWDEITE